MRVRHGATACRSQVQILEVASSHAVIRLHASTLPKPLQVEALSTMLSFFFFLTSICLAAAHVSHYHLPTFDMLYVLCKCFNLPSNLDQAPSFLLVSTVK